MVRFIKKNRNFQFKGILMILGCFILIAAVLFAERSGVQYQEKKRQISYIDKDKIITEKEAADSLKKTCLVLCDSSQEESEQAWIEFQRIFMDMRVGTDVIDVQKDTIPDLDAYETVVLLLSDLDPLKEKVLDICDSGVAGERFCVRNSGATAVVEGVGDHGCEYMTGGTVVVLGQTGKNFAVGMTGGVAYVLDENWDFYQRVNKETVSLEPVEHKYDVAALKELIREHVEATGSPRGKEILDNFSEYLPKFKKVLPYDYDRMLRVIASMEERGLDGEQAQIEAFYAVQKKK